VFPARITGKVADMNITMDITSVSGASAFQQSKVANSVSTSVAAKVLDAERTAGAGALELLQAATVPSSSSNGLDVRG
jgi:hypothetical protein